MFRITTQVEKLWQFNKKTIVSGIDPGTEKTVKDSIRHATHSFLHSARSVCGSRTNQNFHKTLINLKKDQSIKVCAFDKGNGIVIMNSKDYFDKLDKIIYDTSKFQEITINTNLSHPVIRNENNIRNYLRQNVKGFISQETFDSIYPSGSQPGKLYGLCKSHKPGLPLRPVVSMINTAEYNLAKYLDKIIKPYIPSKFMLNSTSSFLGRLKEFCFKPTDVLVSFDVVSLFTNVPLEFTINIIVDHIYEQESRPAYDKKAFKKLLEMATTGIFMYQDKYFRQKDGVTMGSPLGPTLANFCLAYFEGKLLEDSFDKPAFPVLYLRYVDDIFCVFRSGTSHEPFLSKLNDINPNLKFTSEIGPSQLSFLDTCISVPTSDEESFTSKVFRKSTYTGLMLNVSAMCPQKWKFGLIQCFLHRAYMISSSWLLFSKEVDFLRDVFWKNGYPKELFDSCLRHFLNLKHVRDNADSKVEYDKVETIFLIPYIGLPSVIFGRKLKRLLKEYYCIDVKVVFSSFKVKNYFSLKCHTPVPLKANVVYQFTCLRDANSTYIGKTIRHLVTRVKEHSTSPSAIKEHLSSCTTCKDNYSCNSFKVIDSANSDFEVSIKEALYIKHKNPNLNKQLSTEGMSFMLKIFT